MCYWSSLTTSLDAQALEEVLGKGTSSLFTKLMANRSINAVAQAADLRPFPGDSFSDQVLGYVRAPPSHANKPPVGLPVGSAIGAAFVLAVTATLCVYTHRQKKQNRQQKVGTYFFGIFFSSSPFVVRKPPSMDVRRSSQQT